MLTYHGVLASASSWPDEVVLSPTGGVRARAGSSNPLSLDRRLRWAEFMRRTLGAEHLRCECGGERELIDCDLRSRGRAEDTEAPGSLLCATDLDSIPCSAGLGLRCINREWGPIWVRSWRDEARWGGDLRQKTPEGRVVGRGGGQLQRQRGWGGVKKSPLEHLSSSSHSRLSRPHSRDPAGAKPTLHAAAQKDGPTAP